jgi:nitroreductase
MKSRRSIREFSDRAISKRLLVKILEAASVAPTGAGVAGTHILVLEDPTIRRKLREICERGERDWVDSQPESVRERLSNLPGFSCTKEYIETAPVFLAVTTRPLDPEIPYAVESAFLAVGYMLVMIEGMGLGTVTYTPSFTRVDDEKLLDELLDLPEGETVQVFLPIGYPKIKRESKPEHGFYNVYHNQFGVPFTIET